MAKFTEEQQTLYSRINVSLRARIDSRTISKIESKLVVNTYQAHAISQDCHGEYTLRSEKINFKFPGVQEFFDRDVKIFDVHYDENTDSLILHFYANKQCNLFADFSVKSCLISAEGALCTDNSMNVSDGLKIKARALSWHTQLASPKLIELEVENKLNILSPICAAEVKLHASHILQNSTLDASSLLDLSSQVFIQSSKGIIQSNDLRFISKRSHIDGTFDIAGKSFIATTTLQIAKRKQPTLFRLQGEHHLHVNRCVIWQNAEVCIGLGKKTNDRTLKRVIVDNSLIIHPNTTIHLENTTLSSKYLTNDGTVSLAHVFFKSEYVEQNSKMRCLSSDIFILDRFVNAKEHTESSFQQSIISIKNSVFTHGTFSINDCEWRSDDVFIDASNLSVENSRHVKFRNLTIADNQATFNCHSSNVSIRGKANIAGQLMLDDSEFKAADFSIIYKFNLNKSKLNIIEDLFISGELVVMDSSIDAEKFTFLGKLTSEELSLFSENIELSLNGSKVTNSKIIGHNTKIFGDEIIDSVKFDHCQVSAKYFHFSKNNTFKNSRLIGIDDKSISHDFNGKLILDDCVFFTESNHDDPWQ